MKVLITGGAGFIGARLARTLLNALRTAGGVPWP
ncbi:NAD(P)-dependent oxidoreductase [Pseudogulbenkiania sp. MAI-1]|nr:NAD(P)-dependent oxidoreductase [Pseudogulbenkiania sp. MAI-1]